MQFLQPAMLRRNEEAMMRPIRQPACLAILLLLLVGTEGGCRRSALDPPVSSDASPVRSQADEAAGGSDAASASPTDAATASPGQAVAAERLFTDVTSQTGVRFVFHSGREADEYAIIESLGGGVAAVDFDLDGNLDLWFAGGGDLADRQVTGRACGLFRNLGEWSFADTTAHAGCQAAAFYNHGTFAADFDGDGFADLAISGYGGVQLLRNQGDGTFELADHWVTHPSHPWSTGLAWADYDGDGHLDCYVTHYVDWSWDNHPHCSGGSAVPREVCPPREFQGVSDVIYFSDGRGGFRPLQAEVGLVASGKGLGVVAGDINLDGATDLYVANDTTDNFLYLNDGDGRFREAAILAGVSGDASGVNTGSMGLVLADLNQDRLPDIWVTNFERELFALYRNEGQDLFSHVSRGAGIAAIEGLYVGFGTVAIDLELDGYQDLVVANGHVSYHSSKTPFRQQPLLLRSQGDGRFHRAEHEGYFAESHSGRGLAHVDLDNDGSWDLVFTHLEEPAAILRGSPPPHDRWALVQLVGRDANREAVGATVRVSGPGVDGVYSTYGGGSYLSHSDRRIRIVAPPARSEAIANADPSPHVPAGQGIRAHSDGTSSADVEVWVHVHWPSGLEQKYPFPAAASSVLWVEGQPEFVLAPSDR